MQTIVISGSSGLVGSALLPILKDSGHRVRRLVRGAAGSSPETIYWDPDSGRLDPADLEGADAVVHLGGESIASGRWTAQRRQRIRDSRVISTRLLARSIAGLERPPKVFACASAVGYYGNRGAERLTEEALPGEGFLAGVTRQWEEAAEPARAAGVRVVNLRFGVVLSPRGGALRQMLPLFRFGLAGRLGGGEQIWSWVAIDDAAGAVCHVLAKETLSGPVNVTAPEPVSNRQFTAALARVLRRPALLPVPGFALRIALGAMADELLLASACAVPKRLLDSGYAFAHADLMSALRHLVGASARSGGSA